MPRTTKAIKPRKSQSHPHLESEGRKRIKESMLQLNYLQVLSFLFSYPYHKVQTPAAEVIKDKRLSFDGRRVH